MHHNKTKTIVTVGNGVAAWCLHFYLRGTGAKVISISADDFFSPCSSTSTAINCLRGTERGNSPLGDCIIDSMDEFESFYDVHKPDGVSEGHEYQILEESSISKWERRYPKFFPIFDHEFLKKYIKNKTLYFKVKAYFFDIRKFESWIKEKARPSRVISDLVIDIDRRENKYIVKTKSEAIEADSVVLCTNHLTSLLTKNISAEFRYYLDHSKAVAGGYLEFREASASGFIFDESFVLAIEKYHFIYRKEEDVIQIGSSSKNKSAIEAPLLSELHEIYEHVKDHVTFKLPLKEEFTAKSGVRHKGYLRRPFWGLIDDHQLYTICGLYKNAWSFSFKAAKDVAFKIASQEHHQ